MALEVWQRRCRNGSVVVGHSALYGVVWRGASKQCVRVRRYQRGPAMRHVSRLLLPALRPRRWPLRLSGRQVFWQVCLEPASRPELASWSAGGRTWLQ